MPAGKLLSIVLPGDQSQFSVLPLSQLAAQVDFISERTDQSCYRRMEQS